MLSPSGIRKFALLLSLPVTAWCITTLSTPTLRTALAHGPIQSGHGELTCVQCHERPNATWRQQIQANTRFAIGVRARPVSFGYVPIDAETCIGCHERPNERHPIYRFREPRFEDAKSVVDATSCLGCHSEHTGMRAEASTDYCRACHDELIVKSDPLDISHAELIGEKRWTSCLGCHDFHGNHAFKPPEKLGAAIAIEEIRAYLGDGPDPYGTPKLYEAEIE